MDWLTTSWSEALHITVSSAGILAAVVVLIRLNGLRSLSKMSSFDFAVTVAVGSIVASTLLSDSASLLEGVIGVGSLLFTQRVVSYARVYVGASALVDNQPIVLMAGEHMLDEALKRTRVTPDDIRGKLREANVLDLSEVHAVVLESTGDISVLHGKAGKSLDARLLEDVEGAEHVVSSGVRGPSATRVESDFDASQ